MIKFQYIITGPNGTRGGNVFARTRKAARKAVTAMLAEGESIFTIDINRR